MKRVNTKQILSWQSSRRIAALMAALMTNCLSPFLGNLAKAEAPITGIDNITVCMDFSCRNKQTIAITETEWNGAADWLRASTDSPDERQKIKQAIGWMERVVGKYTPTHRDVGGDLGNDSADFPGQLDCIDESINTTTYLALFEENNLLKHHKVVERAYRRTIFDQHWAGQIEDLTNGDRWVIDSWFQNNGYLPYLQTFEKWSDIPFFTSYLDSSQEKPKNPKPILSRLFNRPSS